MIENLVQDNKTPTIAGVLLQEVKVINTKDGRVMHMLNTSMNVNYKLADGQSNYINNDHISIGELYFSECAPNVFKGWHYHENQDELYCVPFGKIAVGLLDKRKDSPTYNQFNVIFLGNPNDYKQLWIPRNIYYAFIALNDNKAIITNAPSLPHSKAISKKVLWGSDSSFKEYEDKFISTIADYIDIAR